MDGLLYKNHSSSGYCLASLLTKGMTRADYPYRLLTPFLSLSLPRPLPSPPQGHLPTLQAMYAEWPFFGSTVDLIEMILAKTDCRIAALYDDVLVGVRGRGQAGGRLAVIGWCRTVSDEGSRRSRAVRRRAGGLAGGAQWMGARRVGNRLGRA